MFEGTSSLTISGSVVKVICYMSTAVPHVVAEVLKENVALDVSYGPATSITVRYVQLWRFSLCAYDMYMYVKVLQFSENTIHTHTHTHTHTLHTHHSGTTVSGAHAVARHLCRMVPGTTLYGGNNLEKAEVMGGSCHRGGGGWSWCLVLFCLVVSVLMVRLGV